jgi:PAS domain S-box-containing protein
MARVRRESAEAVRQSEARVTADARALARLHEASRRLWGTPSLAAGLDEMLAATIELLGADMGNVQLLDPKRGVLLIAAHRGFAKEFLEVFREVAAEDDSACGRALRSGERIVIEDVEAEPRFAPFRDVARAAGYRAVQSTPLLGRDGTPVGMLSTHFRAVHRPGEAELRRLDLYVQQAADFIERCRSDEALRESEQRFRLMADAAPVLIWISGVDKRCTWFNQPWLDFVGRPMAQELGDGWAENVHPEDFDRCLQTYATAFGRRDPFRMEYRLRRRDGAWRWVLDNGIPQYDASGRFTGYIGSCVDITDRREAEAGLRQAVADKETLLREVHHRVKNNLQMICDMLYLQMEGFRDAEKTGVLRDTYGRIYAIARLHEQLFQSMQSGQVQLPAYLEHLVGGFGSLYPGVPITLDAPARDCTLDMDRAIHVGLIVNELVTNALKHAFPNGRGHGRVTVRLRPLGDRLELQVRDNGIGLSGEADPLQGGSLGLRIVHILARRLEAAVTTETRHGACFTITFPRWTEAPREPVAA